MTEIPAHVMRALYDDALTEIRVAEEERHAEFLKTLPVPVHQLIDLDEVNQRIADAREELEANQWQIRNLRAKADKLSRANAAIRSELDELHNRRRGLERTK